VTGAEVVPFAVVFLTMIVHIPGCAFSVPAKAEEASAKVAATINPEPIVFVIEESPLQSRQSDLLLADK